MNTNSEYLIELNNVWKKYSFSGKFQNSLRENIANFFSKNNDITPDEFWALKNINFKVKKGECLGLYGPNGSGKSTILKLISSITYPTKGEVIINGKVAPLISLGAGFHHDLTGIENIKTNGAILGMSLKEIKENENSIINFSEINKRFLDMPVRKYSSGMIARLGFSIAIHSSSEIILLDEILSVGDENFKNKCRDKINELKKTKSIILVSHNKQQMKNIVERIIYIKKGEIINQELVN